jgi:hypothetical protein
MLGTFLSTKRYADILARGRAETEPSLTLEPSILRAYYNRQPFLVGHRLVAHPSFSLPSLFALCRRMPTEKILYRIGKIPGDAELDSSYDRYKRDLTLDDVLSHFEERQAYICINNPELDAWYKPVIEGLLGEIAAKTDTIDSEISWYSTYVFISSRDSVTPYHMDREMNFLLQIQGTKTVHLWDPADREIMSDEEKDLLLSRTGDRPTYKPSFEAKAMTYQLKPGLGVHHPFIAPHRVHTGSELSISLALTFRTRHSDIWTDAHRFNARMRRLGLEPGAVGHNFFVDRAKSELARIGQRVRRKPIKTD